MKYIDCIQGTDEWHRARAGKTTASMFAVAVSQTGGLTEQQAVYVNAIKVGKTEAEALVLAGYKAKPKATAVEKALLGQPVGEPSGAAISYSVDLARERISGGPVGDTFQTYAMKRGTIEEANARIRYEDRRDCMVHEAGFATTDDGLFGYSTDGLVERDGMVEIKTPDSGSKILSIIRTGDISEYFDQIQGGLWVTGRQWCDLIVYLPDLASVGNDLYIRRVWRDDAYIAELVSALWAFERIVQANVKLLSSPFTSNTDLGAAMASTQDERILEAA